RVGGSRTVRDADGPARSSRNRYLSADDRRAALALSRALLGAREDWSRGERDPAKLRDRVRRDTAVPGIALEYVSVADPLTLDELYRPSERAVISLAARDGNARLVDNLILGIALEEVACPRSAKRP